MKTAFARPSLALALAALAALPPSLLAQMAPRPAGPLRIYILQGDRAVNNTVTRVATAPVVEVRDMNDFPVAGATVTFELPASGPSASFEGGKLEYSNISDSRGQASAAPMTPNGVEGQFVIKVTAKLEDRTGVATIRQSNSRDEFSAFGPKETRPSFWRRNRWLLLGVGIGAAAGLGYYFATRDNASGAVLSPGTVVIGGPR
jgi:hypothetical protein